MDAKFQRMKELIELLNRAARSYYQEAGEIMSNFEYDRLYDELTDLERETGRILSDSPTIRVGYEVLSELPKERHESPMLSLDKTKDVTALSEWLGEREGLLSWKLDGLTIVLTYRGGTLFKAVTRGNGEVGEVITNNARVFKNIPIQIPCQQDVVLRGEAVIKYSDFQKINETIPETEAKYKNPRNLCSGSVRQLNNEITAKRNVYFFAFGLVQGKEFERREEQFLWMREQGFDVVEYRKVTGETIASAVQDFEGRIEKNDFPSDGLVLIFDDIAYGQSLGRTAKFPRDSIAFKWQDEIRETVLQEVEWSASRTGLINPIAVFEPVELEGTTVSRASLHNISIMEDLELGVGDKITVYKANMIIPQVADNLTRSGVKDIPDHCPVCGGAAKICQENDVKSLYCMNEECLAKKIKSFSLFVSRDAMNVEGLSEATMEKFINRGFIREFSDIFRLDRYKDQIIEMEGFGEKSYQNLIESAGKARTTTPARLLYSLGIPNIGLSNAKLISREFEEDFQAMRHADRERLVGIDGVGDVIASAYCDFFDKEQNNKMVDDLLQEIILEKPEGSAGEQIFADMNFVVTGSLHHYENRNALKQVIEELGGKVTGSVTSKTNYLINNDNRSSSSKNKKAGELGIPVITEEEFMAMLA
ncbi:NAD-dependent DNA ligase LigA [Anaerolentibacter hominis]|uniref:NAD-dependent DNA ligase LigA n=1 Tax=Anaerolentibacter hominis TaxID=3079009 RepID=UPI0031B867C0